MVAALPPPHEKLGVRGKVTMLAHRWMTISLLQTGMTENLQFLHQVSERAERLSLFGRAQTRTTQPPGAVCRRFQPAAH